MARRETILFIMCCDKQPKVICHSEGNYGHARNPETPGKTNVLNPWFMRLRPWPLFLYICFCQSLLTLCSRLGWQCCNLNKCAFGACQRSRNTLVCNLRGLDNSCKRAKGQQDTPAENVNKHNINKLFGAELLRVALSALVTGN